MYKSQQIESFCSLHEVCMLVKAQAKRALSLRGHFDAPPHPYEAKNENCFSPNSSYKFITTMAKVYKSCISWNVTVAMVAKMASKIGSKLTIDRFAANLRSLTEKLP